jgi:hypothetical protein
MNNNYLQLRLLPISLGAFIAFNKNYKIKNIILNLLFIYTIKMTINYSKI